jgi:hypothetical protein
MQLDKALEFALVLVWDDLTKVTTPCSARVEYRCEPGTSLDYVSVWSVNAGGEQDLVCDFWTWASTSHPSGVRFTNGYTSKSLAQTLGFILMNQDQFTRRADACRDGLVLLSPPTRQEHEEAAAWGSRIHGVAANVSRAAYE